MPKAVHVEHMHHAFNLWHPESSIRKRRTTRLTWPKPQEVPARLDGFAMMSAPYTPYNRRFKHRCPPGRKLTLTEEQRDDLGIVFSAELPFPGLEHMHSMQERRTSYTEDDLALLKERREAFQGAQEHLPEKVDSGTGTPEPLALYRISIGALGKWRHYFSQYDVFAEAIVVARDAGEARLVHPGGGLLTGEGHERFYNGSTCNSREEGWRAVAGRDPEFEETPPGWFLSQHQNWVPPCYVHATRICSYDGDLPVHSVISSSFAAG